MNSVYFFFLVVHRAANKRNNAHFVVFALPMFQGQLRREKVKEKCNVKKYSILLLLISSSFLFQFFDFCD